MANIGNFLFFSSESTEAVSNYYANPNDASAMTIQVELPDGGSCNLEFEGMNDLENPEMYFPIKCVGLGDFKTYDKITAPGLYLVIIDGIYRCRMRCNEGLGTVKAYAIAIS